MRIHRGASMLAAAASSAVLIASTAPAAGAHTISTGTGGGPIAVSSQPQADSGIEWGLIAASAAGGAIVTAAGMTATRRRAHPAPRHTATLQ